MTSTNISKSNLLVGVKNSSVISISNSFLNKTIDIGNHNPLIDFDKSTMSGTIPDNSKEKKHPVRPQPTLYIITGKKNVMSFIKITKFH